MQSQLPFSASLPHQNPRVAFAHPSQPRGGVKQEAWPMAPANPALSNSGAPMLSHDQRNVPAHQHSYCLPKPAPSPLQVSSSSDPPVLPTSTCCTRTRLISFPSKIITNLASIPSFTHNALGLKKSEQVAAALHQSLEFAHWSPTPSTSRSSPATTLSDHLSCSSSALSSTNSGLSSIVASLCSSPTSDIFSPASPLSPSDPPMPRLSEEKCFEEMTNREASGSVPNHDPRAPSPTSSFAGHAYASNLSQDFPSLEPSVSLDDDFGSAYQDALISSATVSHRRHKSGESNRVNISSKIGNIPFFARRRHRKNSSLSTNPTVDTHLSLSSRSSSFASGRQDGNSASTSSLPRPPHFTTETSSPPSPFDVMFADSIAPSESIDRLAHSSTPLLPPMMGPDADDTVLPSPLRSPTIAEPAQPTSRCSVATSESSHSPHECNMPGRPPITSARHSRKNTVDLTRPLASPDKWSMRLGHANFTIEPEPYCPQTYTVESWQTLLSDRDAAQAEYCRHQARTLEHYGRTSNIFMTTEEKWAEIDSTWSAIIALVRTEMLAHGISDDQVVAAKSQTRMPTLNPHIDGKFPKLGDEDIVGPMAQSPPKTQPSRQSSPTRKASSAKLLGAKLSGLFGK